MKDYRADIDGLRGVAVLTVLFYHAHLSFPGGYVGVDVFFVISGFLLTRILTKSVKEGRFKYLDFWERRVRRLIPALIPVTLCTAIAGYFLLLPADLKDLGGALVAQPLLSSNVYFSQVVIGGYFADQPEIRPLLHTWSLGVEEQFYLFYPFLLVLCFRFQATRKRLTLVLGILASLSYLATTAMTLSAPVAVFFQLQYRAWELSLGGLVAFRPPSSLGEKTRSLLGWLGLAMIMASACFFENASSLPGQVVLVPCLGAALVIWANRTMTSSGRILSFKPLVWVGLLSYSLYLWHWPLMAYGAYFGLSDQVWVRWLLVALSFGLSYLSYRFIEMPIRRKKLWPSKRSMLPLFAFYAISSISIGWLYYGCSGFPGNWTPLALEFTKSRRVSIYYSGDDVDLTLENPQGIAIGASGPKIDFIVWGDSHAQAMIPLLDKLGKDYGKKGLRITRASTPAISKWAGLDPVLADKWRLMVEEQVQANPGITVYLISRWNYYHDPLFLEQMEQTVASLNELGAKVVLMEQVPLQPIAAPRVNALATRFPSLPMPFATLEQHLKLSEGVKRDLDKIDGTKFIRLDPVPIIMAWGTTAGPNQTYYSDSIHLSIAGAMKLEQLFSPLFRQE